MAAAVSQALSQVETACQLTGSQRLFYLQHDQDKQQLLSAGTFCKAQAAPLPGLPAQPKFGKNVPSAPTTLPGGLGILHWR